MASEHGRAALLVEDDPVVRGMAARGLREAGYAVLEAVNGREALDLVRARTGRLDVVVTDIGMPEMDGYDLARRLSEERPDMPIVFMSGYGDPEPRFPSFRSRSRRMRWFAGSARCSIDDIAQ